MTVNSLIEEDNSLTVTEKDYWRSFYTVTETVMELKTNERIIDIYKPSTLRDLILTYLNDKENTRLLNFLVGIREGRYRIGFDFKNALKYIIDISNNRDSINNEIIKDTVLRSLKESLEDYTGSYLTDMDKEVLFKDIMIFDMEGNLDFYLNYLGFEITFLILENLRRV